MKKILYIVLDGLGDRACPQLDGKTPLEAAHTPNMDLLAKEGRTGLVYPVGKGIAPESDIAVISILGYEAHKYYTGRGPLESYAVGLQILDGDLAYRVNFATLGEDNRIIDRRVGRGLSTQEANLLSQEINSKVRLTRATFRFKNTVAHRGVLVIHSLEGKLSGEVTNTDPAYGKEGAFGVAKAEFENLLLECKPMEGCEGLKEARDAARLTNEFIQKSHSVLEDFQVNRDRRRDGKLAANLILTRDGGDRLPKFPSLKEKYGLRFGCFVEMPVERGIAMLTGMEVVEVSELKGEFEIDYPLQAKMILENIAQFDGLYVHIKGPDLPGHDGDEQKKKETIEAIDRHLFGQILPSLDLKDLILVVTSDHSTPCILKAHSADPVPLLVAGAGVEPDGVDSFSEASCQNGILGSMDGVQLMPLVIKLAQLS